MNYSLWHWECQSHISIVDHLVLYVSFAAFHWKKIMTRRLKLEIEIPVDDTIDAIGCITVTSDGKLEMSES